MHSRLMVCWRSGGLSSSSLTSLRAPTRAMLSRNLAEPESSFEVSRERGRGHVDQLASRIDDGGLLDAGERVFIAVLKGKVLDPVDDVLRPEAPEAMREEIEMPDRRRQRRLVASVVVLAAIGALVEPYVVNVFLAILGEAFRSSACCTLLLVRCSPRTSCRF